jgi:hypothetical protein
MFKGYDLATDVWQAFSKRTSDQQALEQGAAEHLDKMVLEWAKLDNNARADNLKMLEGFVGDGLYDVYDQDVINMLGKIEDLNGLERGTLIDASVGGYWNRMSNISLKEAQTEQMLASADKTRQTTPLTVEQMKLDLEKTRGQIAKTRSDMANSQDGITKEEKEFLMILKMVWTIYRKVDSGEKFGMLSQLNIKSTQPVMTRKTRLRLI